LIVSELFISLYLSQTVLTPRLIAKSRAPKLLHIPTGPNQPYTIPPKKTPDPWPKHWKKSSAIVRVVVSRWGGEIWEHRATEEILEREKDTP
jgi:hypothetical protein